MSSKWVSEGAWLEAISLKRIAIQRHGLPGCFLPYQGPNPEAVEARHQKELRRLRSSLKRIVAAGEIDWKERLDAQGF